MRKDDLKCHFKILFNVVCSHRVFPQSCNLCWQYVHMILGDASDISVCCRFLVVSLTVTAVVGALLLSLLSAAFLGVRSSATMTFVNGIWVSFLLLALYAFALPFARKQLLHFPAKMFCQRVTRILWLERYCLS